jgi:preprotein translocase subunit SecA
MVKWLSGIFDSTDKEVSRLRRIVAEANEEIERLLEKFRESAAATRERVLELGIAGQMQQIQAAEMVSVASEVRRLATQADALRAVIEQGEQTSRELSVLLADSKQLAAMNAEKTQRPPAERRELEEEIEVLVAELGDQLAVLLDEKPGMREAILHAIPKARLAPQRPPAEEMIKQVEAAANFLGREVADYFGRTGETIVALRRAIGLNTLVDLLPEPSSEVSRLSADLDAAALELVHALAERDLMKHLARQGLRLPPEVKAAAGLDEGQDRAVEQNGRGWRGRDNNARSRGVDNREPDLGPKDALADVLFWEEQATSELLAIAAAAALRPKGVNSDGDAKAQAVATLAESFAGREERLQARTAAFRARIVQARADFWQDTQAKIADVVGVDAIGPYAGRFAELDEEQEALLAEVERQDEDSEAPVMVKPDAVAELMQRRDALQDATFNELMNELRMEDRASADRLKALLEESRKEQRKQEQLVLNQLIPEAFAAVWEASRRTTGMRPYDVQLMGGIVLHEGKISEMKTGEGKTLVAVAPLYLNGLSARGAHLCTVNEYLARRDSDWMGPAYKMLGLSVGVILNSMAPWERKIEYMADVTYGTNAELGFDYLRDNIANNPDDVVQRPHNYCIVDEVDNILIDEARTPLIISGASEGSAEIHINAAQFARTLRADIDYTTDEKTRSVVLTDEGISRAEAFFRVDNLYHPDNFQLVYGVDNALKAHALFRRDKDYVLWQEGKVVSAGERLNPKQPVEVVIVDEFTGRLMQGRRYSEGLHEAIEAKEGIRVQSESQTFATITIQNYFRLYPKLAGMTGTAATEAEEFFKIYKLEVMPIPTHKPMVRIDNPDRIYRTEHAKFEAVLEEIKEMHEHGRPVLVGTVSIEKSEELSRMLEQAGIPHSVLNAKQHEREASIVAQAGQRGAVTIATNMAGRGTDIVLGFGVNELGGLHIVGTERHESRRIDNQLRGRSGRQGDNGSSRFYVSIEDEIMRRSGVNQNIVNSNLFKSLWDETMPIEHSMISRSVEQAQVKMEGYNFDIRKHLVEYDDVVNTHRDVIYNERRFVLKDGDPRPIVSEMIADKVQELSAPAMPGEDGRARKRDRGGPSAYSEMFDALSQTFPDDVIRRLLRSILTSRVTPIVEDGDLEGFEEELKLVAEEAMEGVLQNQLKNIDEKLQDFYHVGDEYYEIAGGGTLDYNKLTRSLGLPLDVVKRMRDDEMEYEDARDFLYDLYRQSFERDQRPKLEKLQSYLASEAARPVKEGQAEARTRSLLETIDNNFSLSPASAARYVEAETGTGSMAPGGADIVEEVQEQLEVLYGEVEQTLGEVFLENNLQMPLISLVDNRLPRSVYRQIEEKLGAERIEEIENIPLGQLDQEVRDVVRDAFVRWQESDLMMRVIDYLWTRHLTTMESLRHSIGLQAYGQKDPLVQYKVKAYELFEELKGDIRQLVVLNVLLLGTKAEAARAQQRASLRSEGPPPPQPRPQAQPARAATPTNGRTASPGAQQRHQKPGGKPGQRPAAAVAAQTQGGKAKLGRNDPCYCGSGRKYKHCHGR